MRQFGLIGYPLSHSFSKKYFSEKFAAEKLDNCHYENYPLPAIDQMSLLLKDHPSLEGINVTIPYKEKVLPFLTQQSEVVRQVQACNCIKIVGDARIGYNTDVTGFELSLLPKLTPLHTHALVLGTGGAAKAVEYVLRKRGIQYRYVSRKGSAVNLSYQEITPALLKIYTLIINTTPLGMFPEIMECPPLPYQALNGSHYLFDLVYNPVKTTFLQKGEAQGATIKNGHDMLLIQAEESWKIWNSAIL